MENKRVDLDNIYSHLPTIIGYWFEILGIKFLNWN
jgi:hypothetical protein